MASWRISFAVFLFCALLVRGLAWLEWRDGSFGATSEDPTVLDSVEIDEEMIKEVVKKSGIFFLENMATVYSKVNPKATSLMRGRLKTFITILPPLMKQNLLHCLKQNIPSCVSGGEDESRKWYIEYLESLFGWRPTSRRKLVDQLLSASSPAPGPAVRPPTYNPSISPDPAPASSSVPSGTHTVEAPQFFVPIDPDSDGAISSSPNSTPPTNHGSTNKKTVVIAVVVTAAVTFLFVSFLFYCYNKCRRKNSGPGGGQRDERPLLAVSFNDFSLGPSPRPVGLQNSNHVQKVGTVPFKASPSQNGRLPSSLAFSPLYVETDVVKPSAEAPSKTVSGFFESSTLQSTSSSNINVPTPPPRPMMPPLRDTAAPRAPPHLPPISSRPPVHSVPSPPPQIPSGPSPMLPVHSVPSPPPQIPSGPSPILPVHSVPSPPPQIPSGPLPPPPVRSGPPPAPPVPTGPPPPPPIPSGIKPGVRPPPPPKSTFPPRPPPLNSSSSRATQASLGQNHPGTSSEIEAPKTKLKPFFWDKVLANPDQSMVWHQIKSGSFQFNEEMIESLFGYISADKPKNQRKESSSNDPPSQYVQILEPKKAQNLAIIIRALNVTIEEVSDALLEGNELSTELLQTLLKMTPTTEEEMKLRLYSGELSHLGPGERFLKSLVDIPFAFKRMDALLFMGSLQEEVSSIKESFETLEVACKELRSSRLFLKLLEAVLKTGNRMNDGTFRGGAQAFKLDTLLKLADVKGADGKTTLLHFVVQEIIRSEGMRASRASKESGSISDIKSNDLGGKSPATVDHYRILGLQVVEGLGGELHNVKKAAALDADALTKGVAHLGHSLAMTKDFLGSEMRSIGEERGFLKTLKSFVGHAEVDITWLKEEEKRIHSLVKNTTVYFHGNAAKDEGLHLFVIVRDFLFMIDKVCKEVKTRTSMTQRNKETPSMTPVQSPHRLLFPSIQDRRLDSSSSDEES